MQTELYFYELLYIIPFGTPADWRCASTGRISSQDKTRQDMPCINVYPTIDSVVYKNGNCKASYAMKKFGIEYQEFLLRFCTHRK